jgi:hypothetical protein
VRIKLVAGRGCLVAEDRHDWSFEANDTAKVFYTQLDTAVDEGVYEAEAWLDSLPTSSAELREEFKKLETPAATSPSVETADPPQPGLNYPSDEAMFASNLSGLAHCYRSILVECFRHGHELGRIVSKAWAGSLALLEKSMHHGRDADSALRTKDEELRAEQCDKEALAAAQAEVERLTLVVAEQRKIIDAADSVRQSELQAVLRREEILKEEVAQLRERTMVAENKLIRRDLEVTEREYNRKRGATVRGLSKAVVEVDEFLTEVELAHRETAGLCENIEQLMQTTMELQSPHIQTADAACQYDPEPEPEPEPVPKGKKGKRKGKGKGKGKGKKGTGKGKGKGKSKGKENIIPEPSRRRGSADEEAAIRALAIGTVTAAQTDDLGLVLPSPMRTEAEQLMANREAQDSASMGLRLASPAAQSAGIMHSPAAGAPAPLSAW